VRFLLVIVFFIFSIGFISAQELPTGTFAGTGFSLEKNGSFILTNMNVYLRLQYSKNLNCWEILIKSFLF